VSERMTDAQRVDRWIGKLMNATKSEDAYIAKDVINNAFEDKEDRIAELEAQAELDKAEINAAFNNAEMFANRIAELEALNESYLRHMEAARKKVLELQAKLDAAEATLKRISEVEPIGDSGYKYGYAWERCVTIAVLALEGEATSEHEQWRNDVIVELRRELDDLYVRLERAAWMQLKEAPKGEAKGWFLDPMRMTDERLAELYQIMFPSGGHGSFDVASELLQALKAERELLKLIEIDREHQRLESIEDIRRIEALGEAK